LSSFYQLGKEEKKEEEEEEEEEGLRSVCLIRTLYVTSRIAASKLLTLVFI
jgi:hypothetical protein